MTRPKKDLAKPKIVGAPGTTIEGVENELIAMSIDLARKQLSEGTASSQVITHFLQQGTVRARLEKERLVLENELVKAKTEALKSEVKTEQLFIDAIAAMRTYSGQKAKDIDD